MTDDLMTLDECVEHMIRNGSAKTRRAARKMLEDGIRAGELTAVGKLILADGSFGPPEAIAPQ